MSQAMKGSMWSPYFGSFCLFESNNFCVEKEDEKTFLDLRASGMTGALARQSMTTMTTTTTLGLSPWTGPTPWNPSRHTLIG